MHYYFERLRLFAKYSAEIITTFINNDNITYVLHIGTIYRAWSNMEITCATIVRLWYGSKM